MLKWVSRLVGVGTAWLRSPGTIAALAAIIFAVGAGIGWKTSRALYEADQARVYQDWAESVKTLDKAYREREKELLAQERNYRATIRKMSREVRTTADGCRLADDSLRDIQSTVTALFPTK